MWLLCQAEQCTASGYEDSDVNKKETEMVRQPPAVNKEINK